MILIKYPNIYKSVITTPGNSDSLLSSFEFKVLFLVDHLVQFFSLLLGCGPFIETLYEVIFRLIPREEV